MEIQEMSNSEIEIRATKLALSMYERMCNELITALTNTERYKEASMWCSITGTDAAYLHGVKDAFHEISQRIIKEINLASRPSDYEVEKSMEMMYREDIDKEFPSDKFRGRGRQFYENFTKLTRKISSLISKNFNIGFYLGRIYEKLSFLKDSGKITENELRKKFINEYIPELKEITSYGHTEDDMIKVWSDEDWDEITKGIF